MLDKDIIDAFREETSGLLVELRAITEGLEEVHAEFPKAKLEEFAQKIDRIMGTAKTFEAMEPGHEGFVNIRKFGELCKATGYKAAGTNYPPLIPIFAAFWGDTTEVIEDLCNAIEDPLKIQEVTKNYMPVLQKRLVWLAGKVTEISKTEDTGGAQNQIQVDALLASFGM